MPGLVTIGSSRRLELTDGEQVLLVESSSSAMLEAEGSYSPERYGPRI